MGTYPLNHALATRRITVRRTRDLSAILAAVLLTGSVAIAGSAQAETRLLVGMGDSYSTGGGIPPVDQTSAQGADQCERSLHAYPQVAADELGYAGESVACGGAVLSDFTTSSRRGAPPQTSGIADADLIAFTMGGNDVGGPNGVIDSSRTAASMTDFAAAVDALVPQLVAAYTDVRQAAPKAEVYVLGYPDIVPDSQQALESCLGARASGLTAADIHYNVDLLNAAIASASATSGAVFVATTPSFDGHEMCTAQPFANAPDERSPAAPGGAMHPNELGHLTMAADLISAIGGTGQPAPPGQQPAPVPPPGVVPAPVPNPSLTPQERAAVRAIAEALLARLRTQLGMGMRHLPFPAQWGPL